MVSGLGFKMVEKPGKNNSNQFNCYLLNGGNYRFYVGSQSLLHGSTKYLEFRNAK